jgi:hypothetical protein
MLEYVVGGLAILSAILALLAWVFHKGESKGMDSACERNIKNDIAGLKTELGEMEKRGDKIHHSLGDKIDDLKNILIAHLDK